MRVTMIALCLLILASEASAQVAVFSLDTTVTLDGTTIADEEVVEDFPSGINSVLAVPTTVGAVDVTAYHAMENGDQLFSLDTAATLGSTFATTADVLRFDGLTYSLAFDSSAQNIRGGVSVDAVTGNNSSDLMLSFDTTVDLGSGLVVTDEDLVRFDGVDFFMFFDGSSQGVPDSLDLDGANLRSSDGHLFLSFDGSGSIGGVDFEDEDILEFDPGSGNWTPFYDGSLQSQALEGADVIAVPEPRSQALLAAGVVVLTLLGLTTRRATKRA